MANCVIFLSLQSDMLDLVILQTSLLTHNLVKSVVAGNSELLTHNSDYQYNPCKDFLMQS